MKTIYNKELAKLAEQMANDGADKDFLQLQMAVAPEVLKRVETIFPKAAEAAAEAGLEVAGKSFEWTEKGNFIIHMALIERDRSKWTRAELSTQPGSRLNNLLFALGQIKFVAYSEPSEEDPLYILIYG